MAGEHGMFGLVWQGLQSYLPPLNLRKANCICATYVHPVEADASC